MGRELVDRVEDLVAMCNELRRGWGQGGGGGTRGRDAKSMGMERDATSCVPTFFVH